MRLFHLNWVTGKFPLSPDGSFKTMAKNGPIRSRHFTDISLLEPDENAEKSGWTTIVSIGLKITW